LLAAAGILVLAGAASGSSSTSAQQPPPRSLGPPDVSGEAQTGQILRASLGRWHSPTVRRAVYAFQWQSCDAGGGRCVDIERARDRIYPVRRADVGRSLRVVVTATRGGIVSFSPSAPTQPVTRAEADAPVNVTRPTITGEAELGDALTAVPGAWTGEEPMAVEYHWRSCNIRGGACRDLERRGQTYSPRRSDVDRTLRVLVLVENEVETSAAMSNPSAVVTPASPAVAPNNVTEPRITGTPRVGEALSTTRGTWTGTAPIVYEFRWFRCEGRGAPDASDCGRISNAANATYVLRQADAGFRIRSEVIGRNAEGQDTATSNPTAVIAAARPVNLTEPSISGTARVGSTLTANRGQWSGDQPITYAYVWLRCSARGDNCSEIPGANNTAYEVRDADAGRTVRVRVIARNDRGSTSAISNPTGVVGATQPPPPPTGTIPVGELQAAGDRLVVASVQFSPNPVTSRTAPITVRVRVTARGGRPVSGAAVFVRATPRVVQGQTLLTQADGWATLTLIPNRLFPQPRSGFNVQFFVKASRPGDPGLGGIAGYRLVQVRLAG
jgi:hypothetical protein